MSTPNVIIVGAGLAGACAAHQLSTARDVLVLDVGEVASGASGAAAGLVNPFPGQRGAPAWRYAEALDALTDLLGQVGVSAMSQPGILRPAADALQAALFQERASSLPNHLAWFPSTVAEERWPAVGAPHGGLWVKEGFALDIPSLIKALIAGVEVRTFMPAVEVGEDAAGAWVRTRDGERLQAGVLVLAVGAGFQSVRQTVSLPLGLLKGQVVRVRRPAELSHLPVVAGGGYVIPDGDSLILGSTYERRFADGEPTEEGTAEVLRKAEALVPALRGSEVLDARAGLRVTVPARISKRRLPMIGPLPGFQRLWGFLGLGSKGLLTAPLLVRDLPRWLDRPESIPSELLLRIDPAVRT